jgi:chorismate mutase
VSNSRIYALRGATTVETNTKEAIAEATKELLGEILAVNAFDVVDVVSVLFTMTPDLDAMFPATAARDVGFGNTALMCAGEIAVPGAMSKVIRVMMHVWQDQSSSQPSNVYLRGAKTLRDDLKS